MEDKNHTRGRFRYLLMFVAVLALGTIAAQSVITATVRVSPLTVLLDAPTVVAVDKSFKVVATAENIGTLALDDVSLVLHSPAGVKVGGKNPASIPSLYAGRPKSKSWNIRCDQPGLYIFVVVGTSVDPMDGQPLEVTDTVVVEVLP